jgi:hypothetical protein
MANNYARPDCLTYVLQWELKTLLLGQAVLQQSLIRKSADANGLSLLQCEHCRGSLQTVAQSEGTYRGCTSKATIEASLNNLIHAKYSKVAKGHLQ